MAESEKKVLEEENATMRAKLADRCDKSVQLPITTMMSGCPSERQEREEKLPCRTGWQSLPGSRQVLLMMRRRRGVPLERRLARKKMGRGARGEAGGG